MNKTVLLVDDSKFMRTYLKRILLSNGYQVIAESSNGKDAISLYMEVVPDIVLLDLTLPDINGISVLKEMKIKNSQANVVVCSAMGQKNNIISALKLGARDFIVKPNFDGLIPALNKIDI